MLADLTQNYGTLGRPVVGFVSTALRLSGIPDDGKLVSVVDSNTGEDYTLSRAGSNLLILHKMWGRVREFQDALGLDDDTLSTCMVRSKNLLKVARLYARVEFDFSPTAAPLLRITEVGGSGRALRAFANSTPLPGVVFGLTQVLMETKGSAS